ncbi:MAG: translation initiation factor [Nannocystaceae bacterium]
MGKRSRQKASPSPEEPRNNPFAALLQLSEQLPGPDETNPQERPPLDPCASPTGVPSRPHTRAPFSDTVVIQRERKGHGGKTVTVIRGIDANECDLEVTAKQLRVALACGGYVDSSHVVLAGDQSERVAAWLKRHGARRIVLGN